MSLKKDDLTIFYTINRLNETILRLFIVSQRLNIIVFNTR